MSPAIALQDPQDDDHLPKHTGCITGFFHFFDRHHPLPTKPKRPSSSLVTSPHCTTSSSPSPSNQSEPSDPDPPRPSLPVPEPSRTFWKLRDSPRLSLDSRIPREIRTVRSQSNDSDTDLDRRSPSVVARLMGLDALPSELRRSSSAPRTLTAAPPPPPAAPPPPESPPRIADHEMLKELLEALQLKGLLRSNTGRRSPIHERDAIVVMRPDVPRRGIGSDHRPRCNRADIDRKPKPADRRRTSPDRNGSLNRPCTARSPTNRKPQRIVGGIRESEGEKMEYRNGRRLLERCDKLLHSIAEITDVGVISTVDRQPSPVSVLGSSAAFGGGGDDGSPTSPSPVSKRCLSFEDRVTETEEDPWASSLTELLEPFDEVEAADPDFGYVSTLLGSTGSMAVSVDKKVFHRLEKVLAENEPLKTSCLHRRLLFDATVEIVEKKRRSPSTWEVFSSSCSSLVSNTHNLPRQVWEELKRVRESIFPADDIYDAVGDALQRDIVGDRCEDGRTWSDRALELSDMVLDIERLVFKDLIVSTIRDLAFSVPKWQLSRMSASSSLSTSRRKLAF